MRCAYVDGMSYNAEREGEGGRRACLGFVMLIEKEEEADMAAHPNQYKPRTNTRRKKVLELQRLSREMGLDGCLRPLVMNSCKVVLPAEKRVR